MQMVQITSIQLYIYLCKLKKVEEKYILLDDDR